MLVESVAAAEKPRVLPVARPVLGEEEAQGARRAILSGWVTQGPEVAAFEREFAAAMGASHACAVSNCTTALHLAMLVAGVGPGDEVVTVSHSYIATANSIRYCGAEPVFVDIDPVTFNIDPNLVQAAITPRTKAILAVHQIGMPCDLGLLAEMARANKLVLIEDAACAAGSEILWNGEWQPIGMPHGDVACFSFHPRKIITTGDGGMLTTNNAEWDKRYRLLRQHGMDVPDTVRHGAPQVIFESYPVEGFNYRMTDIQAAVGRAQLRRLPELIARRRELAARFRDLLSGVKGVNAPAEPAWAKSNWQSYCVRLAGTKDQKAIMQYMLDRGVSTRRGIMCAHREPAYANRIGGIDLPASERAQDECIILPMFHEMTAADQVRVIDTLAAALRTA